MKLWSREGSFVIQCSSATHPALLSGDASLTRFARTHRAGISGSGDHQVKWVSSCVDIMRPLQNIGCSVALISLSRGTRSGGWLALLLVPPWQRGLLVTSTLVGRGIPLSGMMGYAQSIRNPQRSEYTPLSRTDTAGHPPTSVGTMEPPRLPL